MTLTNYVQDRLRKSSWIVLLFPFFFYCWLSAQIPYCHDDWDWGIRIGWQHFITADLNSRYAGNLVVIILTRYPFLKTLVMGTVIAVIPMIAARTVGAALMAEKNIWIQKKNEDWIFLILLGNALMISVPLETWRQTFGWTAGFSNYVVSSMLILVYLYTLVKLLFSRYESSWLKSIVLFIFGIIIQLFLENATVYVMVITTVCMIAFCMKKKRMEKVWVGLFLGNIIGTLIMFSSNMYNTLLGTGSAIDGVRVLTIEKSSGVFSNLLRLIKFYIMIYPDQIWSYGYVFSCFVCIALSVLWLKRRTEKRSISWLFVNLFFFIYFPLRHFCGSIQLWSDKWTLALSAGLSLLFFICVGIQTVVLFGCKEKRTVFLLFLWMSAPFVMLPLVVVLAGGGRCCLTAQIFQILFCMYLGAIIWEDCDISMRKAICAVCAMVLLLLWVKDGWAYYEIGAVKRSRDERIQDAKQGKIDSIIMKRFPCEEYLWLPDPEYGSERVDFFRGFYKIPDDTDLWFEVWAPKS